MAKRKNWGRKRQASYPVWAAMIQRCNNPSSTAYANYGARGIAVCDDWQQFDGFLQDMGNPPEGMTLERIDNDKGYCKENCKWATRLEQANNRRGLRLVTYGGRTQSLRRWAMELGMHYLTLYRRIVLNGWDVPRAIETPVNTRKRNRYATSA